MLGERLLCLLRGGRLEIEVESGRVPIEAEVIERLPIDHGSRLIAVLRQPGIELAFRLEGQDVRSREADVLPEPASGNEKMDDPVSGDTTVEHVEADRGA